MELKSFLFALGLVFANTCIYGQGKNILPALSKALDRKGASIVRTSPKALPPLTKSQTVAPSYTIPRQRFTVLGKVSNGTFIMDPSTDTPKIISQRSRRHDNFFVLYGKLPREFAKSQSTLFRGISINNLAELENLLRNGSQVNKTSYNAIYFSSDPEDATYYMGLQYKGIPVLITVKSSYDMDYDLTNEEDESPSKYHTFFDDIPAKEQEVFAYLYYNGKNDWYHVSLTEQSKIITKLLSVYFKEQKVAKPDTNNKADTATGPSGDTFPNP